MIKTEGTLKIFYSNMIHMICVVRGINRWDEKFRKIFPGTNKQLNNGEKNVFKSSLPYNCI